VEILRGLFSNVFFLVFRDLPEARHPFVKRQLRFVETRLTPETADKVLNCGCIPEYLFLYSIVQDHRHPELRQTQGRGIKGGHVIAPRFVDNILSVMAGQVAHVQGKFDWLLCRGKMLRMLRQIRQHDVDRAILSDCFIRVNGIEGY
jgi:hypothetical protein